MLCNPSKQEWYKPYYFRRRQTLLVKAIHSFSGVIFCGSYKGTFSNSVTLWFKVVGLLVELKSDYLVVDSCCVLL